VGGGGQAIGVQLNQIRNKEKETSKSGGEPAGDQRERSNVGNRFYDGPGILGPLFVQTSRQGSESFFMEDLTHCSGTESNTGIFQDFTDLVDRVVFLPQLYDSVSRGGLAGSGSRPTTGRGEKAGVCIAPELMAEDSEGSGGIAEFGSDDIGRLLFNEIAPQRFILALLGVRRFLEKPAALC
jgi:hypothetical protein